MPSSPRRFLAHLAVLLAGILAASCRPAAALDEAGRCVHDKLRAHRMAASGQLYCQRAFAADENHRALCQGRATNRLRRRLAAIEARASSAGFLCPAGVESLGMDGSLSWPVRFASEETAVSSPECSRDVTTAAQRLNSAYHRCLSGSIRGVYATNEEFEECVTRARERFAGSWQRAAACVTASSEAAADRIVAEVDETVSRLLVRCGDHHVGGFEECDDGNTASDDGCSSACTKETCGRVDADVRCIHCPDDSVPSPDFLACACPHGFGGEPGSCTDVDECATGEGECAEGQSCVNLAGTWACAIPCTAEAFHAALASCGAPSGAIAFDCTNTTISIPAGDASEPRDIDCSNLTIDGAGRGITFQLDPVCWQTQLDPSQCPAGLAADGTCFCPNVDSGEPFLLMRGNHNVVRDLTVRGFFEGIPIRGRDNVVENVHFDRMCDDAFGSVLGGVGNVFRHLDVRNGCDKCSENEGQISATDPDARVPEHFHTIVSDVRFEDCATPLRVATAGRILVDGVTMRGGTNPDFPCDGPRFSSSSEKDRVAVYIRNSLVDGCRRGIRFGSGADGVIADTRIANGGLRGLRLAGTSRVSLEGTTIETNGGGGSNESGFGGAAATGQALLDLGGGLLLIDGNEVTSAGDNSLCFNVAPDGSDRDVDNATATAVPAKHTWWCSAGSPAAQILGAADFEPFLARAPLRYRPAP